MEGHLWKIIQKHLDDYGPTEAEFARRIGTSPQTVSSWKKRGIRKLPDKRLLVGVSDVTRKPYGDVLTAVLYDIRYLPKEVAADDERAAPIGAQADEPKPAMTRSKHTEVRGHHAEQEPPPND